MWSIGERRQGWGETDKEQTGFTLVVQEIDNINTFSQQEKNLKGLSFNEQFTFIIYIVLVCSQDIQKD